MPPSPTMICRLTWQPNWQPWQPSLTPDPTSFSKNCIHMFKTFRFYWEHNININRLKTSLTRRFDSWVVVCWVSKKVFFHLSLVAGLASPVFFALLPVSLSVAPFLTSSLSASSQPECTPGQSRTQHQQPPPLKPLQRRQKPRPRQMLRPVRQYSCLREHFRMLLRSWNLLLRSRRWGSRAPRRWSSRSWTTSRRWSSSGWREFRWGRGNCTWRGWRPQSWRRCGRPGTQLRGRHSNPGGPDNKHQPEHDFQKALHLYVAIATKASLRGRCIDGVIFPYWWW